MFKRLKSTPNVSTIKVTLSSFSEGVATNKDEYCLPFKTAKMSYNFDFSSGALTAGMGISLLRIRNALYPNSQDETEEEAYPAYVPVGFSPVRCWHYKHYDANNNYSRADKLIFIDKNNKLLQYSLPSSNYSVPDEVGEIVLSGKPVDAINYRLNNRDVMILTYANSPMQIYDASNANHQKLRTISNAPNIISMCLHYERLFAVVSDNRNAVYFSDDLDPTQWDVNLQGAGFIEMIDERGELTKVISFGGYVYIFREYGIARLTAYAEQESFVVSQLFTSCGRIYEDTITICGNRVIFLAEDGLYSFDGTTTTKLIMNIENMFYGKDNSKSVGAYFQGKYYLACNLNFFDDKKLVCELAPNYVNNAVIQIDLKTGMLHIMRGADISFFASVTETTKSQLVCCYNSFYNNLIGEIIERKGSQMGPNLHKYWLTPTTDFGYPRNLKIIKEVYVSTKNDFTLNIISDIEKRTLNIKGNENQQKLKVYVKGNTFKFEIETDEQFPKISSPDFIMDVIK